MVNVHPKDLKMDVKTIDLEDCCPMPDDVSPKPSTVTDIDPSTAIREFSLKISWLSFCCELLRNFGIGCEFALALYFLFAQSDVARSCSATPTWTESSFNIGIVSLVFWLFCFTFHHFVTSRWLHLSFKHHPNISFSVFLVFTLGSFVLCCLRYHLMLLAFEAQAFEPWLKNDPNANGLMAGSALFCRIFRENLGWIFLHVFLQGLTYRLLQLVFPTFFEKNPKYLSFIHGLLWFVFCVFWTRWFYLAGVALWPIERESLCTPFIRIPSLFLSRMYFLLPVIPLLTFRLDPLILLLLSSLLNAKLHGNF